MTPLGFLLPESVLLSPWFVVLTAFVSINTVMYVTLAALKTLPPLPPSGWFPRRYSRTLNRSIYPEGRQDAAPPAGRDSADRLSD